jgi:hypothetical protein
MFNHKNVLTSLAVAVVLAGCGGGGDTPATVAATTTAAATETVSPTPPTDNTPPVVVDESIMTGHLVLVGNQVLFDGIGITTEQFADPTTTITPYKGAGAYGFTKGDNAPLQSFGLRVRPEGMAIDAGQTKRARLALELKDRAVGGVQVAQLLIDQVDISVGATNELTVSVPATAKLYVYVNNSAGQSANLTVSSLPADLVKMTTIADDSFSSGLTLGLDAAFASVMAAAQGDTTKLAVFNSLKDFAGEFDMKATVSNVVIQKGSDNTPLVGAPITVTGSGQPAVTGAGVQGILTVN